MRAARLLLTLWVVSLAACWLRCSGALANPDDAEAMSCCEAPADESSPADSAPGPCGGDATCPFCLDAAYVLDLSSPHLPLAPAPGELFLVADLPADAPAPRAEPVSRPVVSDPCPAPPEHALGRHAHAQGPPVPA